MMVGQKWVIGQPLYLSDEELDYVIRLVYSQCGIALNSSKKRMASARISKRLRSLGFRSFAQYFEFLETPEGRSAEMTSMIDAMTTNTTQFFRESSHFDFLQNVVLRDRLRTRSRCLKIWSAGCSTGEEAYSISMVLADYFENERGSFSIVANDISTRALRKAQLAIYDEASVEAVPADMKRKYLMRGTGSQKGNYRIVPELRHRVTFKRLNLVDASLDLCECMDVIFCRNVTIYFDDQTKAALYRKFYQQMAPGGYLFVGHSETLHGLNNQFVQVAPTVYQKPC